MESTDKASARCSFCLKTVAQVRKLISGQPTPESPRVMICDECIELASEILDEELPPRGR